MVSNNLKKHCINMVGHSVIKRFLEQLNIQINTIEKTVKKERLKKDIEREWAKRKYTGNCYYITNI